ncbi:ribonucleoside-diphosphate reductase class Ib glutaredoxin subunit [Melghiribacillus thermohalophilus]|uniref:Ribonucleoside-diphosphate reductase class Ib glutaredoxin subunit n=1 Tax=Melghiribacillus thermohalophilus TaxID=1324956 RepID=A0A4R3MVY7_9BACI|nr:glutaredoxin family protein [Melghiribacillus thermohalophilus]TCT20375.1 ribonucleoside-diphosphate reductase class Ib glutaredoxin subunit [Melghiribacillus thermohalophilus]
MDERKAVVYTSENCAQSRKVIQFLEHYQISYVEKNVTGNEKYLKELQDQSIYGTPVVYVNQVYIQGYQKNRLAAAFHIDIND